MTAAPADGVPGGAGGPRHLGGITAAAGLSQLGAEAERARAAYGEGALIMCDRLTGKSPTLGGVPQLTAEPGECEAAGQAAGVRVTL